MLRNRALPLILMASAMSLAGCSRSDSGNIAATDNGGVADLGNDNFGNDDFGATDNVALANDLPLDNETAVNGTTVR